MAKSSMVILDVLKQASTDSNGLNMPCYRGLLTLLDKGREDIIMNIKKLMNAQPDKYTPTLFATWLEDVDALITRYDRIYNDKTLKSEYDNLRYCEQKLAYDIGESDIDPDA